MAVPMLFTFGYWGWGNSTRQLVQMIDAVEESRGHEPPLFVDLRIRRTVRAIGFSNDAFGRLVGDERYVWMHELGNAAILEGGAMRLEDPHAALDLLTLSGSLARKNRRVIAFCACEFPRIEGRVACHRVVVADKVLSHARRQGIHIRIVEWPGEDRAGDRAEIRLPGREYVRILRGGRWMPIGGQLTLAEAGSLPWYRPVTVKNEDDTGSSMRILSGPARYVGGSWCLPALELADQDATEEQVKVLAEKRRKSGGYGERSA